MKQILPKSLLGRTVLIIVTPLVLLQLVSAAVFYESHWTKVSLGMARGLSGDVAALIELLRQDPSPEGIKVIRQLAARTMGLNVKLHKGKILANLPESQSGNIIDRMFIRSLNESVRRPFKVDSESLNKRVIVLVQLPEGVFEVIANRKRLFSSTTYIFVLWMVGTSMILFGVAVIFMRNQVRPIRRLAAAADAFGKGRDAPRFKPEGATEVRQAASAFISMRDRIQRQITQRTEMLAGVSHDLRTPLTRMKLQLEMAKDSDDTEDLKRDIVEMEHMLEGYLAFARGEGDDESRRCQRREENLPQQWGTHQPYPAGCRRPRIYPATAVKRVGDPSSRHPASGTGKPGIPRGREERRCFRGGEEVGWSPAISARSSAWFRKSWRRL